MVTLQERILNALRNGVELELTEEELIIAASDAELMLRIQEVHQNVLKLRMMTEGTQELMKVLKNPKTKVKEKIAVYNTLNDSAFQGTPSKRGRPTNEQKALQSAYDNAVGGRESARVAGRLTEE